MFQLLILLLILIVTKGLLPKTKKTYAYTTASLLGILWVIQLSSVLLTGEVANYRFYENFNLGDVISVSTFFGKESILLALGLLIAVFLIHFGSLLFRKWIPKKNVGFIILLAGIVSLSFSGGIINNAYNTVRLKFSPSASFVDALESLGIDKKDYVMADNVTADSGKNIIVLSLESFEKGYLSQKLKHLTPNLRELSHKHFLYDMKQTPAGGGPPVPCTLQLQGFLLSLGVMANKAFQSAYENKITNLANVLKTAGYNLQYFIAKKEYSGIDDILKTAGFEVKSEKDFKTEYAEVPWGIHDKDLFAEFKKELKQRKKSEQPFALFLSTISTHFPNGVLDSRMDSIFPPRRSTLELMVSATDYFVGDLMRFLEDESLLSNTVFYIYPDHLLMGTKSEVIQDFDQRGLFLLTNAELSTEFYPQQKSIYQIDIPKIILDGAGVKHNAKFLTDFISHNDKVAFLNKKRKSLLQLNDAALKTLHCSDGFSVQLDKEGGLFKIKNKDDIIMLSQKLPEIGGCYRIAFDEKWRLEDHFPIEISEVLSPPKSFAYLDVFETNNLLYSTLKGKYHFGITKSDKSDVVFKAKDLALLDNIILQEEKESKIVLESNSYNAKKRSAFVIKDKSHVVSRGLTVISFNAINPLGYEHRTFDTYGSSEESSAFIELIELMEQDGSYYMIMAHDSASKNLLPFAGELKKHGLEKLSSLKGRTAYVMYPLNGKKIEFTDGKGVRQVVVFSKKMENNKEYFRNPKIPYKPNTNRFIAHAGGEIDKIKYTNSKEALDFNYEKGFRVFELDIIKTKDGDFVASHDWKHWAKQTKYKKELPVTREEFLRHKIYNKYTPLDIDGINAWFKAHPDAILVTDKVNEPVEFAKKFIDRKRLIMELFTLEAIERAAQNGISGMVSGKPLSEIKENPIAYFKKHKLKYVAISRRSIAAKKDLLKKFRENDIKVYVYHVNFDANKDEDYVLNNEIGMVYGMYADKWVPAFTDQLSN